MLIKHEVHVDEWVDVEYTLSMEDITCLLCELEADATENASQNRHLDLLSVCGRVLKGYTPDAISRIEPKYRPRVVAILEAYLHVWRESLDLPHSKGDSAAKNRGEAMHEYKGN